MDHVVIGRRRPLRHLATLPIAVLGIALVAMSALAAPVTLTSKSLTAFRTCTLSAISSTSTVMTDTYVNQASPAVAAGSATFVEVRSSANANRRTYVGFDLAACVPAIPSSATITGSLVRLFVTAVPAACRTHDIFRVTAGWVEASLTWNNQPFGTTINNPPMGQRTSFITVGAAPCQNTTANAYVNGWDVTTDVQAFVAGTATNHGWMIRDDIEGSATARSATFSSKNNNVLLRAPQLLIHYRASS